jgi:hypothetical protein
MLWQDGTVLVLAGVNIILTLVLIFVYYRNHRLIKSRITFGMLFFAGTFLVHNIMNMYFYRMAIIAAVLETTTFHMVVNFIEMIGIIMLLYVTWE